MPHEAHRESVPDLSFPRQTFVSLLVFAIAWEVLSHLAPVLGIPPFAIPSLVRIARSVATITPIDVVVTLARVIGALIASFVLGLALAMAMYRRICWKNTCTMIAFYGGSGGVLDLVRGALVSGVEFRIGFVLVVVCGPVFLVDALDAMRGVPRSCAT